MNGAAGDRFWVRVPSLVTTGLELADRRDMRVGCGLVRRCRAAAPSMRTSSAGNVSPAAVPRIAWIVQYSRAVKAGISRSRSTTSADGDGLDAPGRQAALDLLAEERAQRVADEPIDDPARLLGVDEVLVDVARMGEGLADGRLGDLARRSPAVVRSGSRCARPPRRARRSPRPRGRGRWRGRPCPTALAAFAMSATCLRRSSEMTYSGSKS